MTSLSVHKYNIFPLLVITSSVSSTLYIVIYTSTVVGNFRVLPARTVRVY